MAEYRKRNGSDVWHWCSNCSNYPRSGYTSRSTKPPHGNGELCNECLGKANNGNCS